MLAELMIFPVFTEGVIIRGLSKVSWERVDVSFHKSRQRYLAHSTIQASDFSGWISWQIESYIF